jgi:cell fate regulator YaaT (PSP1 superfamily)
MDNQDIEDFSILEDQNDGLETESSGFPLPTETTPLKPDTPLYRLRLAYSHETFIAAFDGDPLPTGSSVIVPTRYGKDLAQIIGPVSNNGLFNPSEIVRIQGPASEAELEKYQQDQKKEIEAFHICKQKIVDHRLDMKLVSVHYLLEEQKIIFFFTAESRVDFRELVKDLVGIFKTRIELRQIGVRDESRIVGGLGVCGRGYCCHSVSDKLKPVSIKMAKDQNLSLNSMKISGPCGRLLCCLAYEHGFYNDQRRQMPPEGCKLQLEGMQCKVIEVNPVGSRVRIACEDGRQLSLESDNFEKVDGRWRIVTPPGEEAGTV